MGKLGGKNKDSKKATEKRMKQQLAALARKNAKKKNKPARAGERMQGLPMRRSLILKNEA